MQKLRRRRRSRRLDRDEDIRKNVQPFVERLYELYEETDPSKGRASEDRKLQHAQLAIHIWWQIYGKLLLWAQSQLVGYEIWRDSAKLADVLNRFRAARSIRTVMSLNYWDSDTLETACREIKMSASMH